MQLTAESNAAGPETAGLRPANRLGRVAVAGLAMAGAGLLAAGPTAPAAARLQHRAVQLVAGAGLDWSDVLTTAEQNLDTLQHEFAAQPFAALTQIGDNVRDYAQLVIGMDDVPIGFDADGSVKTITSGFAGLVAGWDQMLHGFTHPDVPGLLDLPQAVLTSLQDGDPVHAFSDVEVLFLDSLAAMIKPLAPIATIPEMMLQNVTSVATDLFGPMGLYDVVKAVDKAFTEPLLGVGFEFSDVLDHVQADLAGGNSQGALVALADAPAHLADALLNGYQAPGSDQPFIGLLSAGGTLDSLLVTWPREIADALTVGTADLQGLSPAADVAAVPGGDVPDLAALFDPGAPSDMLSALASAL